MARLLAGAWRDTPGPLAVSAEEVAGLVPLLCFSGAAGLAWWRLRATPLGTTPAGRQLQDAFRSYALAAALHDREVGEAFALLRGAGLEPVLVKGWAAARLYPHPGLRPYGDLDLCVRPDERHAAAEVLKGAVSGCSVDLHAGFPPLDDLPPDGLRRRSRRVSLGGTDVRILGPEDHLRYLILHLLGHGAWRPLWLCDVAAAVERRGPDFDWDLLLDGQPQRARWVAVTLLLARDLLDASLEGAPPAVTARRLPQWLVPAVLRQWGRLSAPHGSRVAMDHTERRPGAVVAAVRVRWPNAVEASLGMGALPSALPRLPVQLAECARRTLLYVRARAARHTAR